MNALDLLGTMSLPDDDMDLVSDDDVDEAEQGEAGQSSGAAAPPPQAYWGWQNTFVNSRILPRREACPKCPTTSARPS